MKLVEILADWVVYVVVGLMWLSKVFFKWFSTFMSRILYSLGRVKMVAGGYQV